MGSRVRGQERRMEGQDWRLEEAVEGQGWGVGLEAGLGGKQGGGLDQGDSKGGWVRRMGDPTHRLGSVEEHPSDRRLSGPFKYTDDELSIHLSCRDLHSSLHSEQLVFCVINRLSSVEEVRFRVSFKLCSSADNCNLETRQVSFVYPLSGKLNFKKFSFLKEIYKTGEVKNKINSLSEKT